MPKTKKGSKMSIGRGSPHVHNTANKDTTWQHVSGTDCFDYDYKVQSNYYIENQEGVNKEFIFLKKALSNSSQQLQAVSALQELVTHARALDTTQLLSQLHHCIMNHKDSQAALRVLADLLFRPHSGDMPTFSRQLNQTISLLSQETDSSKQEVLENKLQVLEAAVRNFPQIILPSKAKIEKFCWTHLTSQNRAIQKLATKVLAELQCVGSRSGWGELLKETLKQAGKHLASIHSHHTDTLDQHISSFQAHMLLLTSLLSVRASVSVPVDDIVTLIADVLNCRNKEGERKAHTHHLHQLAFELLTRLVLCCEHKLFCHSDFIHNYILNSLLDSQTRLQPPFLFCTLRTTVYSCLKECFSRGLLPSSSSTLQRLVQVAVDDLHLGRQCFGTSMPVYHKSTVFKRVLETAPSEAPAMHECLLSSQVSMLCQLLDALCALVTCDLASVSCLQQLRKEVLLKGAWTMLTSVYGRLYKDRHWTPQPLLLRHSLTFVCSSLALPPLRRIRHFNELSRLVESAAVREENFEVRQTCRLTSQFLSSQVHNTFLSHDPSHDLHDPSRDLQDPSHDLHDPSRDLQDFSHDLHDPSHHFHDNSRHAVESHSIKALADTFEMRDGWGGGENQSAIAGEPCDVLVPGGTPQLENVPEETREGNEVVSVDAGALVESDPMVGADVLMVEEIEQKKFGVVSYQNETAKLPKEKLNHGFFEQEDRSINSAEDVKNKESENQANVDDKIGDDSSEDEDAEELPSDLKKKMDSFTASFE